MNTENKQDIRLILRQAQRIVENWKHETLFDKKENFLYATVSEGLCIMIRKINEEIRELEEQE